MICEQGTIVVVPFPFVDSDRTKKRPVVVLSRKTFNNENDHSLLAMITTGQSTKWPSDLSIADLERAGLATASVIRLKLFTLDNRLILKEQEY